jgi:hypothetical protein
MIHVDWLYCSKTLDSYVLFIFVRIKCTPKQHIAIAKRRKIDKDVESRECGGDPSIYLIRCPLLLVNRSLNPPMMSYPWRFTPPKKNVIT